MVGPAGSKLQWRCGSSGGQSIISGTLLNTVNTATTATYTVTPTSPGSCNGAPFTVTVSINPKAQLIAMTATICNGGNFVTSPSGTSGSFIIPAGTTYSWPAPTGTGFSGGQIGTAAANISGTLGNGTNIAQTAFYTVTPLSGDCTGTTFTITVTVNPVADILNLTSTTCSGVLFTVTPANPANGVVPAGTLYSWTLPTGSGFTGGASQTTATTGSITGTLVNTTTSAVTANYIVTPLSGNCTGHDFSVTVTINPSANITPMSTVTCSGVPFNVIPTDVTNGRVPPATTYSWTSSATGSINGLTASSGQASISGTLTNTSNTTQTATYTVTPSTGGCTGSVFTVTVTLNPVAKVAAITATSICSGTTFEVSPVNGTSSNNIVPAGILYTWSAPSITGTMLPGAGGSGSSISGTLSHTNNTVQTATYIVTPSTSACGNGATFTVTVPVKPVPAINTMSTTICAGLTFTVSPAQTTDGIVPSGTTYTWSAPTGAGFSGGATVTVGASTITGNLLNTTSSAVTATYTVIPTAASCAGNAFTVNVTLNPKAQITQMNTTICSGSSFVLTPTDGTGANGIVPTGTLYSWGAPTGTSITGGTGTLLADVNGTIVNSSNIAQAATYSVTPVSGSCTGNTLTVTVTVNPVAHVVPMSTGICSGATFTVSPANGGSNIVPAGITYSWSAPTLTGNLTGETGVSGASSITGNLTNTSNTVQTATYTVTPHTTACGDGAVFTVTVTINPLATVTTAFSATICSGTSFNFTPATDGTDGTIPVGTTYQWTLPGITASITGGLAQTSATNHIFGTLTNTVNTVQTATYTITPTSGSCNGPVFTATITVNPKASVTPMATTVCTGLLFALTPANSINGVVPSGTTYTWIEPTGLSIEGGLSETNAGITSITGTLVNTSNIARTATYMVTPLSGNCTGSVFSVTVTVSAASLINPIAAATCSGVTFTVAPVNGTNGIVPAGTLL